MFGRDAGMAEAWLCSQEPLVRSAELGCTVDEVESLIKRHEAFQKSAVAWEERFSALEKLTAVRKARPLPLPQARALPCLMSPLRQSLPDVSHPCLLYPGSRSPQPPRVTPISPIASNPHLLLESYFLSFLFHQARAEAFPLSPVPSLVLLNATFCALTPECFDSWKSRRRSGKESGRRRNGGNGPLPQSPEPV